MSLKNKTLLERLTVGNLLKVAAAKGYRTFQDNSNDYNVNIWAIRSNNQVAGKFDDYQVAFWLSPDNKWNIRIYTCTTDPGDHYLLYPLNPRGTAIVVPGQYEGLWKLGYHKGARDHRALIQSNIISVIRDFNKDTILDYTLNGTATEYKTIEDNGSGGYTTRFYDTFGTMFCKIDTGYFGINNHRAHKNIISKYVGKYSAGCIVQNDPVAFDEFISICELAAVNWGNSFTFTLITEETLKDITNEICY